jgi:hypothetical protein
MLASPPPRPSSSACPSPVFDVIRRTSASVSRTDRPFFATSAPTLVGHAADHGGNVGQAGHLRGAPAALAGDDLVSGARRLDPRAGRRAADRRAPASSVRVGYQMSS